MLDFATNFICSLPEPTIPIATGYVAFGSTLAASTFVQKFVGISTGTPVLPSIIGAVTVCFASMICRNAAIYAHETFVIKHQRKKRRITLPSMNDIPKVEIPKIEISKPSSFLPDKNKRNSFFYLYANDIRTCAIGLLAFKLLGGRFWAIAPSSYTAVGSFARWSIPAGKKYATQLQRQTIERMGRRWGCHTCGSRMFLQAGLNGKKFVGDHMPPKSVADQWNRTWIRRYVLGEVPYRFYPQCINCSNTQGSILSSASNYLNNSFLYRASTRALSLQRSGGGRAAYNHGLRPRINHFAGSVLGGIVVMETSDDMIRDGNKERFESILKPVETQLQRGLKWLSR